MGRNLLFPVLMLSCAVEFLNAKPQAEVSDPAGMTEIRIVVTDGVAECGVWHSGKHLMDISRLGFVADIGDFSKLELESVAKEKVTGDYRLDRIKKSDVHYSVTRAVCRLEHLKIWYSSSLNVIWRQFAPLFIHSSVMPWAVWNMVDAF